MSLRLVPLALAALALASCGVKANLEAPMGTMMQAQKQPVVNPRKDPSQPPRPLGEPGGTTPPYVIGP
jgi:hypothetical protein